MSTFLLDDLLTSLVHFGFSLQTQKHILKGCHGNTIVGDPQVFLIVKL